MEAPAELLAALPALATALALLLAWLLVRRGAAASPERTAEPGGTPDPCAPEPAAEPGQPEGPGEPGESAEATAETEEQAVEAGQEEEQDSDSEKVPSPAGPEEEDGEAFSFKYSPGQLRGSQYKKMMSPKSWRRSRDELESPDNQISPRVQKEQLAAIFKLMEDNKETFGEMSEGDVHEQLRLYDM